MLTRKLGGQGEKNEIKKNQEKRSYPGLLLSQKPNDERVALFRRNLLVLSGELDATIDSPKCSLCSELESTPTVNYIACELCGGMVVPFFISSL